jgi:diaminopimelate epimerase
MDLKFKKMHGTGNDYVVVDGRDHDLDWGKLSLEMCQRRFGVGADGLLIVAPSDSAVIRMRMFNPDGSEAEMCGNGLRCFTKYVVESGIVSLDNTTFSIETAKRVVLSTPFIADGHVQGARINMGHPLFSASEIPIIRSADEPEQGPILDSKLTVNGIELSLDYVSLGNPHAVCFLETPVDQFDLHRIGPMVENNEKFPAKINFHIANVSTDGSIIMRSWERGAGATWSCGSGACAVGVAASLRNQMSTKGIIDVPGGTLRVHWDKNEGVFLEGPAMEVYQGHWNFI